MSIYGLVNQTRQTVIASHVEFAGTAHARRVGLLNHDHLEIGHGLLIPRHSWIPLMAIHTFKMKFSIDVFFLDNKRRVLGLETIQPNVVAWVIKAEWVLETPEGTIGISGSQLGDEIVLKIN